MQPIELNIFFFIDVLKKYKKLFYASLTIGLIVSVAVAFLLPVYYESKVIFYPYSPESSDPRMMLNKEANFAVFSDVDQSERFILMGKSRRVKRMLISRFSLYKRYGIDSVSSKSEIKLIEKLDKNLSIKKLENGAVNISAFDQNPDTAALMANAIVSEIEKMSSETTREKNEKVYAVFNDQYKAMESYIQSLQKEFNEKSKSLSPSQEKALLDQIKSALDEFNKTKVEFERVKTIRDNDLKSILIIEEAQPALEKARPFRSLIIGSTLIAIFFVLIITLGFYEYIRTGRPI